MTESPSELLGRAADLIRDRAAAASQGEWKATDLAEHGHRAWWVEHAGPDEFGCIADLSNARAKADAQWISLLSPAVAPHLEAWLRSATHLWQRWESSWTLGHLDWADLIMAVGPQAEAAHQLARTILGESCV